MICDTYVTIGEKCVGVGASTLNDDFDTGAFNGSGLISGGWFNANPLNGLGDWTTYPDGRILIYRAKETELTTHDRAHALAETMLAVLRGSAKVKTVDLRCESVGNVELLDDNDDLTRPRIKS